MGPVIAQPSSICLTVAPGGTGSAVAYIASAPTDAKITASVRGGDSLVALTLVTVQGVVRRPASEAEIMELPPIPPSIREQARREGIEGYQETGRSEGGGPLDVTARSKIDFFLQCFAAEKGASPAVTATLVIESTGWPTIEIPIVVLTGSPAVAHTVVPAEVSRCIEPGEVYTTHVAIDRALAGGYIAAHVPGGWGFMRVRQVIVQEPVRKDFTPEELEELPPYPPSIREEAAKHGYLVYQEVGRAGSAEPVAVGLGHMVLVEVEFSAAHPNPPDLVTSRLFIEGTTWQPIEVPLALTIAGIATVLPVAALSVRQGESAQMPVELTCAAGPATDVALALGMGGDVWTVAPASVFVPRGRTVRTELTVSVDPRAPVGTYPVGFEIRAHGGLHFRSHPFELTVLPALVTARIVQSHLAAVTGSTVRCDVEVISKGGYNVVTLTPSSPPFGVSMPTVTRELSYGAATTIIPVEFVIDPRASLVDNGMLGIRWTTGEGVNQGVIFTRITITHPPESRTFRREITTPAGTALGGFMELTIRSDGTSTFRGHMHGSGFDPYAFRLSVLVRATSGKICVAAMKSGTVGGTLDSTPRDFDWHEENPSSQLIRNNWTDLRNGTAHFDKWYENTGVLGSLEDIAVAVAEFLGVAVVAGPFVAAVVVVGSELGALTEVPFLHPTAVAGVFVAAGAILILGPRAVIPAIVAGVAAASEVKARPLRESEKALANRIFGDTLPYGRILITNFDNGGRAFVMPNLDGSILVCMGDRYDDPLRRMDWSQTFIHELTHAWQIAHTSVTAEMIASVVIDKIKYGEDVYVDNPLNVDGRPWSEYSIERQAQIVGFWYLIASIGAPDPSHPNVDSEVAINHPAFQYIQQNIRMGQP